MLHLTSQGQPGRDTGRGVAGGRVVLECPGQIRCRTMAQQQQHPLQAVTQPAQIGQVMAVAPAVAFGQVGRQLRQRTGTEAGEHRCVIAEVGFDGQAVAHGRIQSGAEHGQPRPGPQTGVVVQRLQQVEAVFAGHHQVGHEQLCRGLAQHLPGLRHAGAQLQVDVQVFECQRKQTADRRVVVDQHHPAANVHAACPWSALRSMTGRSSTTRGLCTTGRPASAKA